jgi:hypothetical protein
MKDLMSPKLSDCRKMNFKKFSPDVSAMLI